MGLILITPAATEPVTLQQCRDFARVTITDEDPLIETFFIPAARKYVEDGLSRQLITATWQLKLDAFPSEIRLPKPPTQTAGMVITYIDSAGDEQTLDASVYQVDTTSEPARIRPAHNEVWPDTRPDTMNAVVVEFKAGYGDDESDVPEDYRRLVMLATWHMLGLGRDAFVLGAPPVRMPATLDSIIERNRFWMY